MSDESAYSLLITHRHQSCLRPHTSCLFRASPLKLAPPMTLRITAFAVALSFAAVAYGSDWKNVGPGVDYQEFAEDGIDVHVTRIDLGNDSIRVVGTRESERGLRVSDFARKTNALVAINGDYFDDKFNPIGLTIGACGQWMNTHDTKREGFIAIGLHRGKISR